MSAAGFPGIITYSAEEENEADISFLESLYCTRSLCAFCLSPLSSSYSVGLVFYVYYM